MQNKTQIKNMLLFSTGEDLYFLIYNVLVTLKELGCTNGKQFKHIIKLAFIIEFVSNKDLIRLLDKSETQQNQHDLALLSRAYSDGLLRISALKRVIHILEQRKLITVSDEGKSVCLNQNNGLEKLFESNQFKYEIENLQLLQRRVKRLNVLSTQTFLESTFTKHGIEAWASL